jgi:tetratricopeptide (TPR) repeat protein
MRVIRVLFIFLAATFPAQTRLDTDQLRNDLFAAMAGNAEALQRVFVSTENVLKENPNHAQALVWHGAATMGRFFVEPPGNPQAAMQNVQNGVAEMDRAVALTPDDLEVRIMRAVVYGPASRNLPPPLGESMLEKVRSDLQHTFDLQEKYLAELGTHPLGELLQALGDVYSRQGKADDAEKYYRMIQTMLKDTEYARRAGEWMKSRQPLPEAQTHCVGCHIPNRG